MADVSPVAFGIFKALKNKVNKAFRVPPKTQKPDLQKPEKFKPTEVPKQTYGNRSQEAASTARRQAVIDANKAGSEAAAKANAARRASNRTLTEGNAAARTQGIRNRVVAGTAGTGGVATAAYLMSGDATIGPVNKPAPSTPSPARTPVADAPKKEFIDWRDRPSRVDARKTFSKPTSSVPEKTGTSSVPERKGISSPGRSDSVLPTMTVTSKGPKYRDVRSGRTTAAQESKFRFRKAKAEKEARKAKTQSISKPAEISKRYELTPQPQAGDKLLNASKTLFPKKPTPAHKNPNAFTKRDLVGTDGMSAGEIKKRFNTEGYTTPPKPKLVRRPGETLTSFNMRKQRTLNAERKADFLSKR